MCALELKSSVLRSISKQQKHQSELECYYVRTLKKKLFWHKRLNCSQDKIVGSHIVSTSIKSVLPNASYKNWFTSSTQSEGVAN